MSIWTRRATQALGLLAAAVALTSCVSAGFTHFATAQTLPPGHVGIGVGAEDPGIQGVPDAFASLRVGLPLGTEIGVRAGMGTLLASLKYHLPFRWRHAGLAVGLGGGLNFNHKVTQVYAPVIFGYRFGRALALSVSQTTTLFLGTYSGLALSAGAGLKWKIGPFYLFPKAIVGYIAPSGGGWTIYGGNLGILGSYTISLAQKQWFGGVGLATGFEF